MVISCRCTLNNYFMNVSLPFQCFMKYLVTETALNGDGAVITFFVRSKVQMQVKVQDSLIIRRPHFS